MRTWMDGSKPNNTLLSDKFSATCLVQDLLQGLGDYLALDTPDAKLASLCLQRFLMTRWHGGRSSTN